jgi:hypothetical protein
LQLRHIFSLLLPVKGTIISFKPCALKCWNSAIHTQI